MEEDRHSNVVDTVIGRLTGASAGSGAIGACSEGSSCKTSRYEEVGSGGPEL